MSSFYNNSSTALLCTDSEQVPPPQLKDINPSIWIISTLTILANTLLITILLTNRRLFKQRQNIYMVSLATTDLLVGFNCFFNAFRTQAAVMFTDMATRKIVCLFIISLGVVLITTSIFHLLVLALERCYLIKHPFKFQLMKSNKRSAYRNILFCWLLALVPASPVLTGWDKRTDTNTDCWTICPFPYDSEQWVWFTSITSLLIPSLSILGAYIIILCDLWTSKKTETIAIKKNQDDNQREKRVTIIIGIITLAFLLCLWPFMVYYMVFQYRTDQNEKLLKTIHPIVVTLIFSNSLINPILYISLSKDIRTIIYNTITCQKGP
eukprot:GFUD01018134.1.p1 GENE.GFUD01018134.1~~GFUD01018134.1.p1  ORF type:complete len:323 (+),score=31.56 GFUD01018134.1:108-1076(+)